MKATVHESTRQVVFQSHQMDKLAVISRILQAKDRWPHHYFCPNEALRSLGGGTIG